jgi:aspartyl-tRNA(Asn)/glutamyl-tRNA(Gln) amidotransferase subunit A
VKDVIDVKGVPTTGGGIILPDEPAASDAGVIARTRARDCVVIGKTNLHEWAFGPTSINPHHGAVRNPWDRRRIAGGSSGGSAVAVAARMCDWAIGTDTGGSIRIPAALCGVVGFKPTLGSIDTSGVIPLSRSLDIVGPLAPDVRTAADAFALMTGTAVELADVPLSELKLAAPRDWLADLDKHMGEAWSAVGARLPTTPLPDRTRLAAIGMTIQAAEAAEFHREWLESFPQRYGADVRARLLEGGRISRADYRAAVGAADASRSAVEDALSGWDALLLPATAQAAPRLDRRISPERLTQFTRPFNASGHPVIVVPATTGRLPVGIQVVGHHGEDAMLLTVALSLERALRRT